MFPLLDAYLKEGKVVGEWWNEKPSEEFCSEKAGVKLPEAVFSTTARTTKNFCIDGVVSNYSTSSVVHWPIVERVFLGRDEGGQILLHPRTFLRQSLIHH